MTYSLQVPPRSNSRRPGAYLEHLLQWADERARAGIPRQAICDALLRAPDVSLESFLEMTFSEKDQCLDEKGARIKAAKAVSQVMVNRDLNGRSLERDGNIEGAIRLYESNISDRCSASTSYERLRAIYGERLDFANAIRVCYAYLLAAKNGADAEQFQGYLDDLLAARNDKAVVRSVLDIVAART